MYLSYLKALLKVDSIVFCLLCQSGWLGDFAATKNWLLPLPNTEYLTPSILRSNNKKWHIFENVKVSKGAMEPSEYE